MSAEPSGSPAEDQARAESAAADNVLNGLDDVGSEDEDAVTSGRRKVADAEAEGEEEQAGDDLFGDDDDDVPGQQPEQPSYVEEPRFAARA